MSGERPPGWAEETHGKSTAPNYDLLFAMTTVHTLEIAIDANDFVAMQEDLADILGESGAVPATGAGGAFTPGQIPGGEPSAELAAACEGLELDAACEATLPFGTLQGTCEATGDALACVPAGGSAPGGPAPGGGGGGVDLLSRDPMYVPVQIRHDGHSWLHVGMRYKGNSSLALSFGASGKLPFRLDFDQFEAEFPEINDQRFHGFKKLTFSSNYSDDSQIRETYVSELLRERGVPAARCAFYRIVVDVGAGAQYWGLYTAIEDPADGAMLDTQLGGRDGNLYKPEGTGADWTIFDPAGFEKKTNEKAADWSDVQAAIAALHAETATPEEWRAGLEATFDVDLFLTWLAVNTTIVNWDSYGNMAHNYYLYAPPESSRLGFIPWDHNMSMMGGGIGQMPTAAATDARAEVFHSNVSDAWPLIQRIVADPVYVQRYRQKLEHALGGLFDVTAGPARMRDLHELIAPYVVGPEGEAASHTTLSSQGAFLDSIDGAQGLAAHIKARHARVEEALNQ